MCIKCVRAVSLLAGAGLQAWGKSALGATATKSSALGATVTGVLGSQRRHYASEPLKQTVLYDYHVSKGAKMVPFAGYSMPIQYKDSIMDSTTYCRESGR